MLGVQAPPPPHDGAAGLAVAWECLACRRHMTGIHTLSLRRLPHVIQALAHKVHSSLEGVRKKT